MENYKKTTNRPQTQQYVTYRSSRSQYVCNCNKTSDFSTLYRTIPHTLRKFRIKELTQRCFSKRNGGMYQYFVIGRNKSCFVKSYSKSNNTYKQHEIVQMLDFFVDNIFVQCYGLVFQQAMGIPMGTNCEPLLADLFLQVYEADFL